MVLCILIGICVSIAYVVNQKKAEAAQQEWQRTSTTVTTTTTLALRDLSDEQILEQCGGKYTAKLGKSDIAIFSGWTGHGLDSWHLDQNFIYKCHFQIHHNFERDQKHGSLHTRGR